jgi:hypothetical protein
MAGEPAAVRRPLPPRPLPARPLPPRSEAPRVAEGPAAVQVPAVRSAVGVHRPSARARPDPTGLRIALGFGGVAAASALVTSFLAPATPAIAVADTGAAVADPASVQHITQYVQLQPGQTAPPGAATATVPQPTPRVVTVTTRQSGTKR